MPDTRRLNRDFGNQPASGHDATNGVTARPARRARPDRVPLSALNGIFRAIPLAAMLWGIIVLVAVYLF